MGSSNPRNVFKGPNSLSDYFDPDKNPPLPLVEIPDSLNPLRKDGVRIYAKILTALPAQNVKSLPALNMLQHEPKARQRPIVEASSGSTALSLGIIARALWGHEDVCAYVTNKKHIDQLKMLRFFGLKIALYGGLGQQEPSDPKGIMQRLRSRAEQQQDVCYLGQYHNDHNWKSHERWTGSQIWQQLPEINILSTTVGTGGCIVGTGVYLKSQKPSVKVVGVCNVFGDPTPGPRHLPGFESSPFPWRETIDVFESVKSVDSYRTSMALSRCGIIAGPSSGEALHGLLAYLEREKAAGRLVSHADPATGEVSCVFVCADLPYQYMDLYFSKLPESEFPPILNKELLDCDLDPYDERWFLTPHQAAALLTTASPLSPNPICPSPTRCICTTTTSSSFPFHLPPANPRSSPETPPSTSHSSTSSSPLSLSPQTPNNESILSLGVTLLDLRPEDAFARCHLRSAHNVPLPDTPEDFFGDAGEVRKRWHEVTGALKGEAWLWEGGSASDGEPVLVLCSDGDTGRMAAAALRARGREAYCVEGGFRALVKTLRAGIVKGKEQVLPDAALDVISW